ncbi:hypothetical protein [Nocardioides sp. SYSU DS0651]|uniref:hypothetical protein n=1 Tax=Nocardioides sp. SYSU DS0651 TaxID=3415955 RepID=UPI003F4B8331
MTDLVDAAALLVTAAGVLVAIAAWALTRSHSPAVPLLIDFLLAAGLLRLTVHHDWQAIGAAALVVVLRKVVAGGIGRAASVRRRTTMSSA